MSLLYHIFKSILSDIYDKILYLFTSYDLVDHNLLKANGQKDRLDQDMEGPFAL